jgi:hypothetical protein
LNGVPALCPLFDETSGLCGDPHIYAPNGISFEFYGKPDASYSLFSTPNFVVNMRLATDGPTLRFVKEAVVLFRNESFYFNTLRHASDFAQRLDTRLARVGGKVVAVSPYSTRLEFCPGQAVTVTQMHISNTRAAGGVMYFLDINVAAPGCADLYDGVLGQTYHCKYKGGKGFSFSRAQEESFRIQDLTHASGHFSTDAVCNPISADVAQSKVAGGGAPGAK